ncbi:hypothetical protein GYMLUDRAFT_179792 [Collybiopsis luxurians FD-317 M1]|uniref:CxC2-like cysteine cluster KDZ transposase-associated domain-containing protein n=1 Tax=Collybiopsis luxurians FD-317 M1 TaxID=944289 RepID=A0A0D0BDT3_9AGAR|nr:hypothetical protein GYMLUDRAFT_179792 [Collybiopsis luxurians FD-317 M1]
MDLCLVYSSPEIFVILDTSRIHSVLGKPCECHHSLPLQEQLLCAHLWPVTVRNPHTTASFDLLNHFQLLSFMSKIYAEHMYNSLECLTDNTGINIPSVH